MYGLIHLLVAHIGALTGIKNYIMGKEIIKKLLQEGIVEVEAKDLLSWFDSKRDHTFIFFDTETTGLSDEDHVIQLGAVACYFNPETYRFAEIDKFNMYARLKEHIQQKVDSEAGMEMPSDFKDLQALGRQGFKRPVFKINHYDVDRNKEFEDIGSVLKQFKDFLDEHRDYVLVAHNAKFDLKMINLERVLDLDMDDTYDTIMFFRKNFHPILDKIKDSSEGSKGLYDRFPNLKDYKTGEMLPTKSSSLVDIVKAFDVDINAMMSKLESAHDAVVDCRNTIYVFEKALGVVRAYLGLLK